MSLASVYLILRKYQVLTLPKYLLMVMMQSKHYLITRPAETVLGGEVCMPAPDIHTEWKTFHQFLSKKTKDNMKLQLKELATNKMLETMFLNLNALAKICLSIPVGTASVERSFSEMKMIKTRLKLEKKAFHT